MADRLRHVAAAAIIILAARCLAVILRARTTHGSVDCAPTPAEPHPLHDADWRLERDRYEVVRRGLHLGLPPQAYSKAMHAMRKLELRAPLSTAPRGAALNAAPPFTWSPIGPQPILNEIAAEFGGGAA